MPSMQNFVALKEDAHTNDMIGGVRAAMLMDMFK